MVRRKSRRVVDRKLIRSHIQEKGRGRRGTGKPKPNRREAEAKRLAEERGYVVLQSGWPDMLLWREADRKAVFLEVKAKHPASRDREWPSCEGLRASQKKMHAILKELGLNVQIIHVE